MFSFIKRKLKNIISGLLKPTILFESTPDFSDNSRAVYDEMLRRRLDKKYYLDWFDKNREVVQLKNGVPVWSFSQKPGLSISKRIRGYSAAKKTICQICCNRFLWKNNDSQFVIYLSHGTPIKSVHEYYYIPEEASIDAMLAAGNEFNDVLSYELRYPRDKIIPLGFPRNDCLTAENKVNIKSLFCGNFDKVIVWYPTYRQHKNGFSISESSPLQLIDNYDTAAFLNRNLSDNRVLLVIKPHFAQDITYLTKHDFSNIVFIDDSFYSVNRISSYQFLAGCDALLSDYSSVIFDYILCDKPVGLIWTDLDEYKRSPGFAVDIERYTAFADKIYSIEDLLTFVKAVSLGKDDKAELRQSICARINISADGKNAERVVDYILSQIDSLAKST